VSDAFQFLLTLEELSDVERSVGMAGTFRVSPQSQVGGSLRKRHPVDINMSLLAL
jgi:hypothetical protein